ncbi:hypothetical protein HMPREF0063_10078 [Aeromicrobium marinum DSM 15272]|uniref:Uncharacterized protein n=1 Tax=Aeromicrobium marinum DSM 15272 TaxID=585531 RepID=E2S7S1_9ACTN|nr:hypothetical protein [Aeromicrobium marinum]EFQ84737.1 hypothetical protein HMPREF0063_10078 [Aeromicrobium marinum DSM 15272]
MRLHLDDLRSLLGPVLPFADEDGDRLYNGFVRIHSTGGELFATVVGAGSQIAHSRARFPHTVPEGVQAFIPAETAWMLLDRPRATMVHLAQGADRLDVTIEAPGHTELLEVASLHPSEFPNPARTIAAAFDHPGDGPARLPAASMPAVGAAARACRQPVLIYPSKTGHPVTVALGEHVLILLGNDYGYRRSTTIHSPSAQPVKPEQAWAPILNPLEATA